MIILQNYQKIALTVILVLIPSYSFSQGPNIGSQKSDFWQHVQLGGGIGLGIGSGYTDISIAPSAIYNFNQYVAAGVGLQGSYVKVRNNYESYIYGGSLIGLFTPIEQIQLSLELEQLRVNTMFNDYTDINGLTVRSLDNDFFTTAFFVGAGYRTQNVTIGVRYNMLYDNDKSVYSEPFMPFVRVYF